MISFHGSRTECSGTFRANAGSDEQRMTVAVIASACQGLWQGHRWPSASVITMRVYIRLVFLASSGLSNCSMLSLRPECAQYFCHLMHWIVLSRKEEQSVNGNLASLTATPPSPISPTSLLVQFLFDMLLIPLYKHR